MIKVRVPATTANIGPGFDCLGIALNLYCYLEFEEIEEGLLIEECEDEYCDENNLIYQSMKKVFGMVNYKPKGIRIRIKSDIPISRGLGSSAACIVGGLVGANEISGGRLTKKELLDIANTIEGHPDNVTPAMFGGMTASVCENSKVYFTNMKVSDKFHFYALIPDFEVSTEKARSVLPKTINYKDAVYNIGRVSLLINALMNGDENLLKISCKDKLHEDYRKNLINDYDYIKSRSEELGSLAVFISGSGSTIMAVTGRDNNELEKDMSSLLKSLKDNWSIKKLKVDYEGVVIL
ncbi:Homoserine kinase [Caloramator mitchellensis]|uniref:Homoserine kinase n=1 Tax=Caloramator mitchellensis TaxID=908809 RepID=A0A0R3K0Y2_CALMK|nr:homoserine kinase [Caloramator mitchellensis]KRQ86530.1 Homoserine kinase [Caloramator mitchellensis]